METDYALPCLSAFQEHHHDLLRFFTRKLGCRDLAADCTQDTYDHLVRMGQTVTVQNPRAFLFRVAANLSINYLRKARIRSEKRTGKAFGKTNKKSCRTVTGPTHNMSALSEGPFFHACSSETPLDSLSSPTRPAPIQ